LKNEKKKIVSINSSCITCELVNDSSPISYIQEDDIHRNLKLTEITSLINNEISILIRHFNPFYQSELDEKLSEFYLTKQKEVYEKFLTTVNAEASLSQFTEQPSDTSKKSRTTPVADDKTAKRKTPSAVPTNELLNYFNSNYFGLFTLSLISKAVCMASCNLAKIQMFERISQYSFDVGGFSSFFFVIFLYFYFIVNLLSSQMINIICLCQ